MGGRPYGTPARFGCFHHMSNQLFGAAVVLLSIAAISLLVADTGPRRLRGAGRAAGVVLAALATCAFFGGAFTT